VIKPRKERNSLKFFGGGAFAIAAILSSVW